MAQEMILDGPQFVLSGGILCLDFVNTRNYRADPDEKAEHIQTTADLLAFAVQTGLLSEQQARACSQSSEARPESETAVLERIRHNRDVLFRIFSGCVSGNPPAPGDLAEFNQALASHLNHLLVAQEGSGFHWGWDLPGDRVEALLGPILFDAGRLLVSADLARVRECAAQNCGWLFLDQTRNASKRWCDMRVCGNRAKVRRFRQRQE